MCHILINGGIKAPSWGEVLKVFKCLNIQRLCINKLIFGKALEPRVIECLLCRDSQLRVKAQHSTDKILGCLTHSIPLWRWETELALFNSLENQLIVFAVEWRVSTQEDVKNDTTTPYITLLIVLASKNLWGDVISCTKTSFKLLAWVKVLNGRTEIDDFNNVSFVETLIWILKQEIFGL